MGRISGWNGLRGLERRERERKRGMTGESGGKSLMSRRVPAGGTGYCLGNWDGG